MRSGARLLAPPRTPAPTGSSSGVDGFEYEWRRVTDWEPATNVAIAWHLNPQRQYHPEAPWPAGSTCMPSEATAPTGSTGFAR